MQQNVHSRQTMGSDNPGISTIEDTMQKKIKNPGQQYNPVRGCSKYPVRGWSAIIHQENDQYSRKDDTVKALIQREQWWPCVVHNACHDVHVHSVIFRYGMTIGIGQ